MHIKTSTSKLRAALKIVSSVASRKTTIPILSMVRLEAAVDALVLTATDLDITVKLSIPAEVVKPGVIALPAKRLAGYVALLTDDEVSIKTDDKCWASVSSGKARSRMAGMDAVAFPDIPSAPAIGTENTASIGVFPVDALLDMFTRVKFAISREASRFSVNGAYLEGADGLATMVATDGHRMAITKKAIDLSGKSVIIPVAAMPVLVSVGEPKDFSFTHNDDYLFFRGSAGAQVIVRGISANFPDFRRVIPATSKISVTVNTTDLKAAINRVSQFSDERSHSIKLSIQLGALTVSAGLSDQGDSVEEVPCDGGEPIEIGLNARYISDFLSAVASDTIHIHLNDGNSAAVFTPAGTDADDYKVIIMPMRL